MFSYDKPPTSLTHIYALIVPLIRHGWIRDRKNWKQIYKIITYETVEENWQIINLKKKQIVNRQWPLFEALLIIFIANCLLINSVHSVVHKDITFDWSNETIFPPSKVWSHSQFDADCTIPRFKGISKSMVSPLI